MHCRYGSTLFVAVALASGASQSVFAQTVLSPRPARIDLTVERATKGEVRLHWTALGDNRFALERRTLRGADWKRVGGGAAGLRTGVAAVDSTITPSETYVYRVVKLPEARSRSNEVTVGPPPPGFSPIAPLPAGANARTFGLFVSLAQDENGDPAVAFLDADIRRDGPARTDDGTLFFSRWDRARYRWTPPYSIDRDINGLVDFTEMRPVSLAFDPRIRRFGVAYLKGLNRVFFARSDDGGVNWQPEEVQPASVHDVRHPVLTLHGGETHIAFFHRTLTPGTHGYWYAHRNGSQGAFNLSLIPIPMGKVADVGRPMSMGLDTNNRPGLLYAVGETDTAPPERRRNLSVVFWRPGQVAAKPPVVVMDSADAQVDDPFLALAFHGVNPRVATLIVRPLPGQSTRDAEYNLWWSASNDGGDTWTPALLLPRDDRDGPGGPVGLAINSLGRAHVVCTVGSPGPHRHGQPKLLRSASNRDMNHWVVGACDPTDQHGIRAVFHACIVREEADNLYVAFQLRSKSRDEALSEGVWLWREGPGLRPRPLPVPPRRP